MMDEDGTILKELTYRKTRRWIEDFVVMFSRCGECYAIVELTGNLWLKNFEILESHSVSVKR